MSREEAAVSRLLIAVEGSERGLSGDEQQRAEIMAAIEELKELGSGSTTTGAAELSATWRLLWTTEKETLFILQRAGLFGTQAGDVYQVIDVDGGTLQNVITFPPEGAFIVDSGISISGEQRTDFKFRSATLKLPKGRRLRLPPFGQGWFDTVYVDDSIRVAQDVRGDTLVVAIAEPLSGALQALQPALTLPGGLAALAALLLPLLWFLGQNKDDWKTLPGPPASSLVLGHLKQVSVSNAHRFFADNTQRFGADGMWRMRLLHQRVVVLSDPSLIQIVLSRKTDLPKATEVYKSVDELFGPTAHPSFFSTPDNEEWRMVRKATAPAFSLDNIRRAFPAVLGVASEVCDHLAAQLAAGQAEVDITDAAMRLLLDVIGQTGYGYDFKARKFGECELFEVLPPVLAEFTLRSTDPTRKLKHQLMPWLEEARLFNHRVKVCWKWWDILMASVRATDLAAADAAGDTGLRACLARLSDDDDVLRANVAVYLVGGFETTSHTLAWTLYEVASNPSVQQRIEAELATAGLLGPTARPLEFADLAQLAFLNCVLKEALRLHPVAANGTIRKANRDIVLGGRRFGKGTLLWVPLIAPLTSQHNWERAEDFWPERWEAKPAEAGVQEGAGGASAGLGPAPTPTGHASNPSKTYLPFSDGPRDCVGQNLALMEARTALATILGRFRVSVAPRMGSREDVRAGEVMKLTLQSAGGMHLCLEAR
ncbi:hypothetical protein ABPG77_005110 [Micractinium sp. CCAP 211/92]